MFLTRSQADLALDAADDAAVFRIIADARTPVFVTIHASGRRRYGYWQPFDSRSHKGGCYVALPTAVCDRLHRAGRIILGDPMVDPAKTTYRVWPASRPAAPTRIPTAPIRVPAAPVRAGGQALVA
ncbi:hypothetical protein ACFV6E_04400 [Streptomyces sp. NPDC059785]|uniref:hypothetical protein n=1 Tax=unclassified Streptomyces TaxID=2593676 RepID=UPI003661BC23